jgi:AcrR family transcriptional regulator
MMNATPSRTQADRADQTKARILDAAVNEFSVNGLAGARTEQIAEAAGVNKALLYYYFQSKQALYDAALESVAARVVTSSMAAIEANCSAGERLVQFALNHFDRIHSQQGVSEPDAAGDDAAAFGRGERNRLPLWRRCFAR